MAQTLVYLQQIDPKELEYVLANGRIKQTPSGLQYLILNQPPS